MVQKKTGPDVLSGPVFFAEATVSRAQAPVVAAEAEVAVPGRCRSPGLPNHPGRSASREAAEAAVGAAEAEAAERSRNCR